MGRVAFFEHRGKKKRESDVTVALVGNPNVGKSTLFNSLTGMKRHTGNWSGKTVSCATAEVESERHTYSFADVPGTYSLLSHSYEEEVARNYICFGGATVCVVVLDATSLEHSLGLLFQTLEVSDKVVVALNLMDEAKKRGISVDCDRLSTLLGVPVVPTVAKQRKTLDKLLSALDRVVDSDTKAPTDRVVYHEKIRYAVEMIKKALNGYAISERMKGWIALRLIEGDLSLNLEIERAFSINTEEGEIFLSTLRAREYLFESGIDTDTYRDEIVGAILSEGEKVAKEVTTYKKGEPRQRDIKIDKIMTGKYTAIPIMLLLVFLVMWITMVVANYPSRALATLFMYVEGWLSRMLSFFDTPPIVSQIIVDGIFRTVGRVVAVMLPPMAIFFPMFALLEDSGYLPRVAYNLDRPFACAGACGKQALTMCMGLGCNAVGISGARIISSRRERLIAILTNSLMPCNGKLPMLVSLISVTFICAFSESNEFLVSLSLVGLIVLAVLVSFLMSFLLSKTVLRGELSSFTLELPPYRKPDFFKVIYRSLTTKALSVLGRAVVVAVPAGLVIFLLSRIFVGGQSLISHASDFLDPFGRAFGMDGATILAFILGLPANEIVLPILAMIYTLEGSLGAELDVYSMAQMFMANGWDITRSICVSLFALFHFPCSTSIITVYKETKSVKYTLLATALPLLVGLVLCATVKLVSVLISL